jgi:hypothetical protein
MKSGEGNGYCRFHLPQRQKLFLNQQMLMNCMNDAVGKILEIMANFQQRGSNWRFKSVVKLEINTFVYRPLKGSSYIPLPAELVAKKAIINIQEQR